MGRPFFTVLLKRLLQLLPVMQMVVRADADAVIVRVAVNHPMDVGCAVVGMDQDVRMGMACCRRSVS